MPEASSSRRPSSGLDRRTGASASASKSPQRQDSAEVEEDLSQARGQAEASDGGEDDDDDEEEGVYEVERIINHKVTSKNGRIKLLVKWTGYDDPEDNTWEYEEDMRQSAHEVVDAYWADRPNNKQQAKKAADEKRRLDLLRQHPEGSSGEEEGEGADENSVRLANKRNQTPPLPPPQRNSDQRDGKVVASGSKTAATEAKPERGTLSSFFSRASGSSKRPREDRRSTSPSTSKVEASGVTSVAPVVVSAPAVAAEQMSTYHIADAPAAVAPSSKMPQLRGGGRMVKAEDKSIEGPRHQNGAHFKPFYEEMSDWEDVVDKVFTIEPVYLGERESEHESERKKRRHSHSTSKFNVRKDGSVTTANVWLEFVRPPPSHLLAGISPQELEERARRAQWQPGDEIFLMFSREEANKKCPQKMLRYYEARTRFPSLTKRKKHKS
ncbi:unnamed protein product [Jaminaea pallidilutea]